MNIGQNTAIRLISDASGTFDLIGRLRDLSELVVRHDLSRAAEMVVDISVNCFYSDASILLHVSKNGTYTPIAWKNISEASLTLSGQATSDETIRGIIYSQSPKAMENMFDIHGTLKKICDMEVMESLVCIPASSQDNSILLICMFSHRHSPTIWETEALCTITNQVATIANIEHQNGIYRKKIDRINIANIGNLYKIARSITSTLDFRTIVSIIRKQLTTLVPADVCAVVLYSNGQHQPKLLHGWGIPDADDDIYIKMVLSTIKSCKSSSRRVLISDLTSHEASVQCSDIRRLGLRSALVVPLTIKHRIVGHIAIYRWEKNAFSKLTARLMLSFAQLASIAIDNARLYEQQSDIAAIARQDLLPRRIPGIPGFEVGHRYSPAFQVGGDYYDLIRLSDNKFGIVMADVSGRDVQAAAHISMCKHSLRALAPHIQSPSFLLKRMNHLILASLKTESFISMFYAILDTENNTLTYASAGHEPPIMVHNHSGMTEYLYAKGILLGIVNDAAFDEKEISVEAGDVILLYTDGLMDALTTRSEAGTDAIEKILSSNCIQSAEEITDNVHRLALHSRAKRAPDDIALLAIRRHDKSVTNG